LLCGAGWPWDGNCYWMDYPRCVPPSLLIMTRRLPIATIPRVP